MGKKDIPVEPNPGVQVTFTYDQPYTDKFGNNKWLCVDGQYVQCSPTLLKMLESQNIKANMPVSIGKRQIDGKSHFTVNGQTASELLVGGGAPLKGNFSSLLKTLHHRLSKLQSLKWPMLRLQT